jgi:hypothetical protein
MKSFVLGPAVLASALIFTGCGSLTLGDKVQVQVDTETQNARLTIEMSDGLQVNLLNGEYPLPDGKGKLIFVPATKTENARIGVEVSLAALAGGNLGLGAITTLPNGAPMPVAMTPPLLSVPVIKNGNYDVDALFSVTPEVQIGAAIGIKQLSNKYIPGGVSLCQNFRNEEGMAFAAVCLYGPSDTKTGGIFVGANFGDLLNLDEGTDPVDGDSNPDPVPAPMASRMMFTAKAIPQLNLSPMSLVSSDWGHTIHDPSKSLSKNWQKAEKNVRAVLKAK